MSFSRAGNSPGNFAARLNPLMRNVVPRPKIEMASAARTLRAEYRTRYVCHAQMEPLNATASVSADGKSAEIWAGSQGSTQLFNQVARLLDKPAGAAFNGDGCFMRDELLRRIRHERNPRFACFGFIQHCDVHLSCVRIYVSEARA